MLKEGKKPVATVDQLVGKGRISIKRGGEKREALIRNRGQSSE